MVFKRKIYDKLLDWKRESKGMQTMRARRVMAYAVIVGLVLAIAGCERAKKAGSEAISLGEKAAHETGKVVGNAATAFFSGVGEGIKETSKRDDISRIKAQLATPRPHAGVWTQPMAGTLLAGLTDDRGLIVRGYRVDGEAYERIAVPDGCTISPLTAKGRTYLVYDVRSASVVSVGDLQKAVFVGVPKGFECKFGMGNDVYLLKSRSGGSWSVWRPLEGKLVAWPYVPDPEVCVGGVVLARSTRDNSRCSFGFGLHAFPDCEGVTGGTSIGDDDEAVVTLWFETGERKLYLPPKWDEPQALQAGEMVMGVKSNGVEIVRNGVRRRIELPPR